MNTGKPRIVVVNDDRIQLALISKLIEQDGAEVRAFGSAKDALAYIAQAPEIDLVITDLRMPGIDGWRFCRLLRSTEFAQAHDTPILVVSATFSQREIASGIAHSDIDAFLGMPYSIEELQSAIHSLLNRRAHGGALVILLAAADAVERQHIAGDLMAQGYHLLEAENSDQVRSLLAVACPDVVILDHAPPAIDATALIPIVKQASRDAVVAVMAEARSSEQAIAMNQQGADIYTHKPLNVANLVLFIERARQERAMLRVEDVLAERTRQALRNAERVQRLNDCFVDLGTDYDENISRLAQAAGNLLGAACAFYREEPLRPERPSTPAPASPLGSSEAASKGLAAPLVIHNALETSFADVEPCIRRLGVQTYMECPVVVEGFDVGLLAVGWIEDREPEIEDLNTLHVLVQAIALQEQMKRRGQELTALNEIGRVVTSALTLDEMLRVLRSKARDTIGAEVCSIALIDPATGELVFRQADDPLAERVVGQRLRSGQGIAGQVAQTGQSELILNAADDPRFYDGIDVVTGFSTREVVCAPLIAKDKVIGVIELLNKRQGLFTSHDVQLLESVAAQTASAIENARLHEITQHELNERIQAERRLQTLIDAAPDLIYLKDRSLRYLLVNQAFAAYWGLEPQEIVGHDDAGFMPEEMARANQASDWQILSKCQVIIEEQEEGERVIETRKAPVLDTTGQATGIVGIIRDITERKRLQEQLILEQKEESVLTLAGGIAHDFNNALVGIVGNIDLLRMDLPRNPEIDRTLRAMDRSAQRMVSLTEQLLAYAGSVKHQFQIVNMNKVVQETTSMMRGGFLPNIAVQHVLANDLWSVQVNPTQIRQVLVNLITNACEAMAAQGGTLTIQTENACREAWVCGRHHQHPAGEYVHLVVHDTGPGIARQAQKRLFEPFYTTKFMGRGLGLAVAMGILRDHEGCIEIESHSDSGVAVHVYLPRTGSQGSQDEPPPHTDQASPTLTGAPRSP